MRDVAFQLARVGLIAIIRADSSANVVGAAHALAAGGVRAMEVTLNTPGALAAIGRVREAIPDMLCGAGTILSPGDAAAAIGAGAQFVITPTLRVETIALCNRRGVATCVGCASPTEALAAHGAGADFIKVFPATTFGLAHVAALLEEMPQLNVVPTGGVTPDNLDRFIFAGCKAVAVGSNLVGREMLARGDWDGITASARLYVDAVAAARERLASNS